MSLKLLTLNIESYRHLERVRPLIAEHSPDVLCLQEVLERDLPSLTAIGGYTAKYAIEAFLEVPASGGGQTVEAWGLAVLTRVPIRFQGVHYYSPEKSIPVIQEPDDPRSVLIMTELEHAGQIIRFGTTHFTWSPNGTISNAQREDFACLKRVLSEYPDYVLCGDFNAPRGREMFSLFEDELHLTDHLPPDIRSTLDPKFHRAGDLQYVVDTIFATREYSVRDVKVIDGISDHKAIGATIGRNVR